MNLTAKSFVKGKIVVIFTIAFCALFNLKVYGAGELDLSFNGSVYGTANGTVNVVKKQADGKVIIGGFFSAVNGIAANSIAKLNVDGSTDISFNVSGVINALGASPTIHSIAVQSDGKILVGGIFSNSTRLRRINPDGSRDTSFTEFSAFGGEIHDIEVLSDGKILIGGSFSSSTNSGMARFNPDGTRDPTLGSFGGITIKDLEVLADGNFFVGGFVSGSGGLIPILRKLTPTGQFDESFAAVDLNSKVEAIKVRPNGQILIAGFFTTVNGFSQGRIALLNSNGSLDLTFNQNMTGVGNTIEGINDIEITADNKILIGGKFGSYNNIPKANIARLNFDGTLDTTFSTNTVLTGNSLIEDLEITTDDKPVVGTNFSGYPTTVLRFNTNGTVDSSYNVFFTLDGRVNKIVYQPNGKILIGGNFIFVNGVRKASLARFEANGSLDNGFQTSFNNQNSPQTITAIAVQPDGKILIGQGFSAAINRLNEDGSLDNSFSQPLIGATNDIIVLGNGQILVSGSYGIRRLNANGTNDDSFAPVQPNGIVYKMLIQPDGKILICGAFTQIGTILRGRIARLNPADGSLDTTFNPIGGANKTIVDMDLQSDGKIVVGGDFTGLNGVETLRIGRLLSDGFLDNTFHQSVDGIVWAVKIQPDNKILIGGGMAFVQNQLKIGLSRLNTNGSLDSTFTGTTNTTLFDIALQADNKVLVAGEFTQISNNTALRIARLKNSSAPLQRLFDYDGDGRADVSVFRPSENRWYIFRSSDGVIGQQPFAISGDLPVPADFDGDGKTDIAIFRPASGDWWSLASSNNAQITANLGNAADIKLPSDFDGDGRADYVIFRPSNNVWYRLSSATGMSSNVTFGLAGDKPVSGDFDGDGKSDVAIYRPSTGDWWYQSSINGAQLATRWGISTDIPTPADFDGDGKTDFAVYRASTGVWYIYNSSTGNATIMAFGLAEDKPIAADYDGDGKADIAVFRPSTGIWYQMRSTAGFTALQFGISTDVPTPNSFVQ